MAAYTIPNLVQRWSIMFVPAQPIQRVRIGIIIYCTPSYGCAISAASSCNSTYASSGRDSDSQVTATHVDEVQIVTTHLQRQWQRDTGICDVNRCRTVYQQWIIALTVFGDVNGQCQANCCNQSSCSRRCDQVDGFQLGYAMDLLLSVSAINIVSNVATVTHTSTTSARLVAGDRVQLAGATNTAFNTSRLL